MSMENRRWLRWDHLMRVSHLYTGLFLVPWMLVYAVSAFLLNHNEWFTGTSRIAPTWQVVQDTAFNADETFPQAPEEQVGAILKHLNLQGPHQMLGTPDADQLTMYRFCGTGHYRITWHRKQSRLVVEKQRPFTFYSLVNYLHFQHGYGQPYLAHLVWAVVVDLIAVSTLIWLISGVWIWARRPRKRLLGGMCLAAGSLLFAGLVVLLCR
jgi:hypothetical protein